MAKKSKAKKPAKKAVVTSKVVSSAKAGVGYWRIIRDSLKFSFSLDKLLLVYLIMVPLLAALLWFGYSVISLGNRLPDFVAAMNGIKPLAPDVAGAIAVPILVLFTYIVIIIFLQTLVRIGIIENAGAYAKGRKESIFTSIKASKNRYWIALSAILVLAIFSGLISVVLGAIPYAGSALSNVASIIIALLTFVFLQALVLAGFGLFESYKESYNVFVKNPGETLLMVLAVLLVEIIMVLLMIAVFLPFCWSTLMQIIASGPGIDPYMAMVAIQNNFAMLSVGVFVVAVLWAYLSVFADAVKTFFYLRIRKI